jgi:putative PIN family toxin of toxin-antitoxin system
MIAIVIDTNVFISAFLKGGKPLEVLESVQNGLTQAVMTIELEAELREVVQRPKFKRYFEARALNAIQLVSDLIEVSRQVAPVKITNNPVRDAKDLKFLECAVAGEADYLITGDDDLLVLEKYEGIRIVTPAQFLSVLFSSEPESDTLE